MKCVVCGFDNEAREAYCRACGSKVEMSLDDVHVDLIGRADLQMEQASEEEIRRWLVGMIALFMVVLTAKVLFGPGSWPTNYVIPSSGASADYAVVEFKWEVPLQPVPAKLPEIGPK
ncbi:MAG: hypothetical protein HUU15_16880 [Candidatus Brocadiae bacterium]|nr:hypothetical protein [Candidatus Brocadiia bacterium]